MATCPECHTRYADGGLVVCAKDGAALVPDELVKSVELAAGTMVGEYRVDAKIGEGGFGSVYGGQQPVIGKPVAIKVLALELSRNAQVVSRFLSEARAVNQIRHKNIVDIFSFGTLPDGRQYFVMELLQGKPLDEHLRERGRLEPLEVLPILRGVLRALGAAHASGLAHRDLKPENVFLVFDEDGGVEPKLIDFGIAKLLGDESAEHKTRTGTPIGTPYYMSPEQCRGKKVDHRTDLYAVGAMLHQLLTGKRPFTGDSAMDVLYKQMAEAPPKLSDERPELPRELEALLLRLMEKDPDNRPQTAAEALSAFEGALGPGSSPGAPVNGARSGAAGLASGQTLASRSEDLGTLPSSQTPSQTSVALSATLPKRTAWLVVGGAIAFGAAVAAFAALRGGGSAQASSDRATITAPLPSLVVRPAPDPVASSTPSAPLSADRPTPRVTAPTLAPNAATSGSGPTRKPRYDPGEVQF